MKRLVFLFTASLFLLGIVAGNASAQLSQEALQDELPSYTGEGLVGVVRSFCLFGLFIDTRGSGQGDWDFRLYVSNISPAPHNFDIYTFVQGRAVRNERSLAANGVRTDTCETLGACDTAGWLYIESDAPIFGTTLFIINSVFGGGSFTAQTPFCAFNLQ